jgi:RNA polymerase sporulation-specific sigma factor
MLSPLTLLLNTAFLTLRLGETAGSFPKPLSAAEERRCVALSLQGDMEARNTLIERNLRLVAHICKKYYSNFCEQDDLISIGTVGLIKGIASYDPDKGVRLATYASRCVENEILMYFRSQKKTNGDISLSEAIDEDGEGKLSILDVLGEDEEDLLDRISLRESCRKLRRCMEAVLTEREKTILILRYGLDRHKVCTQWELAELLGISRSYVSRLEKKALAKLRRAMEEGNP